MNKYKAVVVFHAENDADGTEQVNKALDCFDDGYELAALREVFETAPDRLVFIEGEDLPKSTR